MPVQFTKAVLDRNNSVNYGEQYSIATTVFPLNVQLSHEFQFKLKNRKKLQNENSPQKLKI